MATISLRSGRRHSRCSISASTSSPSRNRITISATTARSCTNSDRGSISSTSSPPSPRRNPATTNTAVRDRNERWASPDASAPAMSSPPRIRVAASKSATATTVTAVGSHTRRATDRVRITVLGKSPAWQDADGACSGYLVEAGGLRLLLDCGPGVFAKLRCFADYAAIDAVVISHLHADHILDLVPFASGLRYAPRQQPVPVAGWPGTDEPAKPLLHAPPGAREAFAHLSTAGAMRAEHIEGAFALREYDPAGTVTVGELTLRFAPVPHFIPCNAVELSQNGARLTFSADCAPNDALTALARDTDLLLIEATLPRPE